MVMTQMRTACHRCRDSEGVRTVDEDGVIHTRQVPSMGDGTIASYVSTAGGFTAVQSQTCPLCGGTGWLPGFVIPA